MRAPVRHGRARIETSKLASLPRHILCAPVRHGRARIETDYVHIFKRQLHVRPSAMDGRGLKL